jgi:glycosyltransferase involved in cell wall biosynthesis
VWTQYFGVYFKLKILRIAFLTPQYPTEGNKTGGVGTYVYRMVKALHEIGCIPEVFTFSKTNSEPFYHEGIRVERVRIIRKKYFNLILGNLKKIFGWELRGTYEYLGFAVAISRALKKRQKDVDYHFIHSSDFFVPGLFVRKKAKCPLVVRSSWARDLCLKAEGIDGNIDERLKSILESNLLRRADIVYAPSDFVAHHNSLRYARKFYVLRPSYALDAPIATTLPWKLPTRYLLHFSSYLGPVKGTDILAEALSLIWKEEPEFKMVWVGRESLPEILEGYCQNWGKNIKNVVMLGEIEKSELYKVVKDAEATVLPSRYDNFPNTAIESLALGVSVIGPNGASFNELVEPGINGELAEPINPTNIAEILLKVWRNQVSWIKKPVKLPQIFNEMQPNVAATNLIKLINRF